MIINKCMQCMEDLSEGSKICPHCGFDEGAQKALPHQLPYGSVLNGVYMVGKAIGEGGFGITYIGWDLNLGIKVAIKEFYPEGFVTRDGEQSTTVRSYQGNSDAFFKEGREKFLREARSLGKFMQLDGIVSVKDFFQENNTAYIVMEYLKGKSLKELVRERCGRMEAEELLPLIEPVVKSLIEVHKSGVIHRDISPDNIFICDDGKVKLIDFGAAREVSPEEEKTLSVTLKKGYSPEEQYRSHGEQGAWTDVYALSATIYAMLTGVKPDEPLDRMEKDTLKPLSAYEVKLSKRQENVLLKGLEVKSADRVQTVEEIYSGLYQEGKEKEFAIRRKKKRGKVLGILAVLLVLCVCVACVLYGRFVPEKLKTALWVDAQIGQEITADIVLPLLPEDAGDVVFYMGDAMTGSLLVQSAPEEGEYYALEVHYKADGRDYIQALNVSVVLPEIKTDIERITLEAGSTLENVESCFSTRNADFVDLIVDAQIDSSVAGTQQIIGRVADGTLVYDEAVLEVEVFDTDAEEIKLFKLLQETNSKLVQDDSLEKCADALLDAACSEDMKKEWSDILSGATAVVKDSYPEVSYAGAILLPYYRKNMQVHYEAECFADMVLSDNNLAAKIMAAEKVGIEIKCVYDGEDMAVYYGLFYR